MSWDFQHYGFKRVSFGIRHSDAQRWDRLIGVTGCRLMPNDIVRLELNLRPSCNSVSLYINGEQFKCKKVCLQDYRRYRMVVVGGDRGTVIKLLKFDKRRVRSYKNALTNDGRIVYNMQKGPKTRLSYLRGRVIRH